MRAVRHPAPPRLPYLLAGAEDRLFPFSRIRFIGTSVCILDSHKRRTLSVILLHQHAVRCRLDEIAFIGPPWSARFLALDGNDLSRGNADQRIWFALQSIALRN